MTDDEWGRLVMSAITELHQLRRSRARSSETLRRRHYDLCASLVALAASRDPELARRCADEEFDITRDCAVFGPLCDALGVTEEDDDDQGTGEGQN